MQPLKLKIGFARFPYAGSGSNQAEYPAVADWLVETILKITKDPRCDAQIWHRRISDTPITMSRNQAILAAQRDGVDVLVFVDADMAPDLYVPHKLGKPFWDTSFDFLYQRWSQGPCIVFAPYCGPPPHPVTGGSSVPYVFQWTANQNHEEKRFLKLDLMGREEVAFRAGIEEVAAAPTGLMMLDMRIFQGGLIPKPWFDYEWEDPPYNTRKATTEDVYFTRNCWLAGIPVLCNWDSWAGHVKQEIVGKPIAPTKDDVQQFFFTALQSRYGRGETVRELNPGKSVEQVLAELGADCGENVRLGRNPAAAKSVSKVSKVSKKRRKGL